MAKVKQPLLSFDARRKLGDDIVFLRRGRTAIAEKHPEPQDAKSPGQLSWRHMFQKVVALWHALSAAEKEAWESLGRKRHMTGYAWFVAQALRPNPGIYLPLQGGVMQGIIDMDGFSIIELPAPSGSKHATRRSYVIARIAADILTHKGDASAHHIRYSDGEALAAAEAGGLSRLSWKDVPGRQLNDVDRIATLDWTDLDLTAATSASAKYAIVELSIHIDAYTDGVVTIHLRQNGKTPSYMPLLYASNLTATNSTTSGQYIIRLDSGQVLEYRLGISGTAQADFKLDTLGYIE